jgi:hypothetical protein
MSMGYYIETPGRNTEKAVYLVRQMGGIPLQQPPASFEDIPQDKALIVVVDNGMFEACGLVYSPGEFKEFVTRQDDRPRQYILMDKEVAHKASGYKR